ncbi:hypothetical protein M6B38_206995 [Iris pallida]|uniref:Uncharacterized protein n=1 Tax=Iris pallida TaxID=29817 RepID=A0AAX6E686_IRIPA|nr:hypothetical protein M6B38_206995 [Iris pallida]
MAALDQIDNITHIFGSYNDKESDTAAKKAEQCLAVSGSQLTGIGRSTTSISYRPTRRSLPREYGRTGSSQCWQIAVVKEAVVIQGAPAEEVQHRDFGTARGARLQRCGFEEKIEMVVRGGGSDEGLVASWLGGTRTGHCTVTRALMTQGHEQMAHHLGSY